MAIVDDSDVEKALDHLRFGAARAAKSKGDRVYLEAFSKSLKAILMQQYPGLPLAGQEREALADPKYLAHLEGLRAAVVEEEAAKWKMTAAQATIECWRTSSANQRIEAKIG